jgi:hypothetical protein
MMKMKSNYAQRRLVVTIVAILAAASGLRAQTPLKSHDDTPGSWRLVLLPDTQHYSAKYPGLFVDQTRWIAKNAEKYNIRYVLGLGDITNNNTDEQWRHAKDAIAELDGHVPYALAAGNHDYTRNKETGVRTTGMNKCFPPSTFEKWPTFGGVMKPGDVTNCYHLFSAGGTDWIIVVLEWAPTDDVVRWANKVLAKYPQRKAILVTHAYLFCDNARYDYAKKGKLQGWNPHAYLGKGVNDGEELWQKLVKNNHFALTFNGHVCATGLGFLISKNDLGERVAQMLVNYQMRPRGGEAYLRIVEFLPDGKTVHVKSYSPLLDKYLEDAGNQFSFKLDR